MGITLEGFSSVRFEAQTPVGPDDVSANVRYALSLGLPEADRAPIKTLHVIANGPSASLFDFQRASHRQGEPIETLALNGALRLFTERNIIPTYWAACDAQRLVADFVTDAPFGVKYLVASRCHPRVFGALRGRDVEVWHVAEEDVHIPARKVPRSCTITLCALTLMRRLYGYRHFEIYGWDGSFDGMTHHASEAPLEAYPEGTVQLKFARQAEDGELIEGHEFMTTQQWAAESQEAIFQLQMADYSYTIHGPGMIGELVRGHVNRQAVDG